MNKATGLPGLAKSVTEEENSHITKEDCFNLQLDESPTITMPGENLQSPLPVINQPEVVGYPTPKTTPPPESSSSHSCMPTRKSFSKWRETCQWGLNQASAECRESGELRELLDLFSSITTEAEYLSLDPKYLSLPLLKFGRITIKTLNMHYRQLMIALFRLNKAGEMGEQRIRSFQYRVHRMAGPKKAD